MFCGTAIYAALWKVSQLAKFRNSHFAPDREGSKWEPCDVAPPTPLGTDPSDSSLFTSFLGFAFPGLLLSRTAFPILIQRDMEKDLSTGDAELDQAVKQWLLYDQVTPVLGG